jgi:hypothetical protein
MRQVPVLLVLLAVSSPLPADTPAKEFRSKGVQVRLEVIADLRAQKPKEAEQLLIGALTDPDREVVESATTALREPGGEESVMPLLLRALPGPVRRIRFAAVDVLARLAPEKAAEKLLRCPSGDAAVAALEALHRLGPAVGEERITDAIARGLADKEEVRMLAEQRIWGSRSRAAARDLSAFRFITNFVRHKRKVDR